VQLIRRRGGTPAQPSLEGSAFPDSNVVRKRTRSGGLGDGALVGEPTGDRRRTSLRTELGAEAVRGLFHESNRVLVAFLTARLQSAEEAKEVAQEAYVRLLQIKPPEDPSLLRARLFKIAANLAIDRLRHRAVRRAAERDELSPGSMSSVTGSEDLAATLAARERVELLLRFIEELPARCRRILELHRLEGLTQQEVGARLGLSDRMVRRHITYAMLYCRLRLDGMSAAQAVREVDL
jgi:RNA polymerase sigma factor (sigma-70 family)